jgi:hypothetical protein
MESSSPGSLYSISTFSMTTLSIMTFSITTLSIKGLIVTLSISYYEEHVLFVSNQFYY